MIFSHTTDIINTVLTSISVTTVVTASLIIPTIIKKTHAISTRKNAIEEALLDAFNKYFSDTSSKNDFEWYFAELIAITKKYDLKHVVCLHCKRKLEINKYMDYFKKVDKIIPEINNFSVKAGKSTFKIELTVLTCYKCKNEKQFKIK